LSPRLSAKVPEPDHKRIWSNRDKLSAKGAAVKIVLAFDSFKGSLTAKEACRVVAETLRDLQADWHIESVPLADGGEGTAQTLVDACLGLWRFVEGVTGPLPEMQISAPFGWLPETRTAVIEMARASGLPLLTPAQRNPLRTTTFGTGQLLAAGVKAGARRLILTLGGSATVDGGTGAARALGWRFLDAVGQEVPLGGEGLLRIAKLVAPSEILPPVEAWYDVRNPLLGSNGAARVYGPQKGADEAMVAQLEKGLEHLADLVERQLGMRLHDLPGGGAAGGFGFGAKAFLGAQLAPGAQGVMQAVGLEQALAGADWVITGEGALDSQSLQGKVVGEVARLAGRRQVKVAVLTGRLRLDSAACQAAGLARCEQLVMPGMSTEQAISQAGPLLAAAACRLAEAMAGGVQCQS